MHNEKFETNRFKDCKHTLSRSTLESISNNGRDSYRRNRPQTSLAHTNTMKVALIAKPITVVIKFILLPNI